MSMRLVMYHNAEHQITSRRLLARFVNLVLRSEWSISMERITALAHRLSFLLLLLLSLNANLNGQQTNASKIRELLATSDCANVEGTQIKVCKYDYRSNGLIVEAITFRPAGEGRVPGVLLIPGFQRTALDLISLGVALAREGIAGVGISQPGFGRSQGKPDYVGPNTLKVLKEGFEKFKRESYVNSSRRRHL
jgi:hypothetical protein